MTAGYFAVDDDGADLYLHREDYEACVLPNSLKVSLSSGQRAQWAETHKSYVAIKARYTPGPGDSIQCGTLDAVETVDRIPGRER